MDPPNLIISNPVDSPNIDKFNPDTPDGKNAATHIHDVFPARTMRSRSVSPTPSGAEEEAESPSECTRDTKRYKCNLERLDGKPCHRTFARQSDLNRHQMRSGHVQPMPCPFCIDNRWLRHRRGLFDHVKKTHPTQLWTVFRCPFCTNAPEYASYKRLVAHVGRSHPDEPLEARYRATRGF